MFQVSSLQIAGLRCTKQPPQVGIAARVVSGVSSTALGLGVLFDGFLFAQTQFMLLKQAMNLQHGVKVVDKFKHVSFICSKWNQVFQNQESMFTRMNYFAQLTFDVFLDPEASFGLA